MIALDPAANSPKFINVRVKRQDGPGKEPYWQLFKIDYEPELNVITILQRIAALSETSDGKKVAPVVWDCGCLEEVCGACTMQINGRVRQSCSALVDQLLKDNPDELVLEPMSKVSRHSRFDAVDRKPALQSGLEKVKAWVPVDSYYNMGPGERQLRAAQEQNYPLSQCMSCGCCVDSCPQFNKIEVTRKDGGERRRVRKARGRGF